MSTAPSLRTFRNRNPRICRQCWRDLPENAEAGFIGDYVVCLNCWTAAGGRKEQS